LPYKLLIKGCRFEAKNKKAPAPVRGES